MPLRESEAIVLRTTKLGEADKIVTLLTRQWGRLRAVAQGARRPKSRWGALFEPMTHIRAWIFERENRDLLRMNSADLIESFFEIQKDYRIQVAAQYLGEVTERLLPEREPNERAFRLLVAVLKALKHRGEVDRPLVYFDYWMVKLGGFLPDFERCSNCGRSLDPEGFYGRGAEGLVCRNCKSGGSVITALPRDEMLNLRQACAEPLDKWLRGETVPGANRVRHFLEEVIRTHTERNLVTAELLGGEG
jgi:DNA repair protein RecO (recombination protein O)